MRSTSSVLLIVSNPELKTLVSEVLKRTDPEINLKICSTYEEAFAHLFSTEWDSVLIDEELPSKNALLTLKKIRLILGTPRTKVILLARMPGSHLAEEAKRHGATELLSHQELVNPEVISRFFPRADSLQ